MDFNQAKTRNPWLIVFLLFLVQVINFFDKGVVGLAAIPMMAELGLSKTEYGFVASSFFSLYAVSGICVGLFAAERVPPKWLLVILVLIWSFAQIPIALTSSLSVLIASRIILGVGEGPSTPTSYNACFSWFPNHKRNLPLAVNTLGSGVGILISAPVLTYFIITYGWRSAFLVCGGLGFIWLIAWLIFGADGPYSANNTKVATEAPEITPPALAPPDRVAPGDFWLDRTMIASIAVAFCAYWITGFGVAWMPQYLQTGLGYDPTTAGWLLSGISGTGSIVSFLVAWLSQWMLGAGHSSRMARGMVNGVALIAGGLLLIAAVIATNGTAKLVLLATGIALPLSTFTIGPAMIGEIAPRSQNRRAILLVYSGITVAGFLSPISAGFLMKLAPEAGDRGFNYAILLNAGLLVAGGLLGAAWLKPETTILRLAGLEKRQAPR